MYRIFNAENSLKSDYYSYFCVVDIRRTLKCPGVQKGNIHDFQKSKVLTDSIVDPVSGKSLRGHCKSSS